MTKIKIIYNTIMTKVKIQEYCEQAKQITKGVEGPYSESTKEGYINDLGKLERELQKSIEETSEQELWDFLENNYPTVSTRRKIQNKVKKYRMFCNVSSETFTFNLKKDRKGVYINLIQEPVQEPVIEPVNEPVIEPLPSLDTLKESLEKIENKEHKLIFSLIMNNDLKRLDLANIKIRNFDTQKDAHINSKTNTIIFTELNKTFSKSSIQLNKEQSDLYNDIHFTTDYLVTLDCKVDCKKNRCNSFGKRIKVWSKKYFGEENLTNTMFRKIDTTTKIKKNEHLPLKLQLEKLREDCNGRDHSIKTALDHYNQESKDITVSEEFYTTLNLIGKDNKVRKVNIEDLRKILDVMDLCKK